MDYTTLIADKSTEGSIKYFVRHSEVPSTHILTMAESFIYARLRCREMVNRIYTDIASGENAITLPVRFREPISLWLTGSFKSRLILLDHDHFEQRLAEQEDATPYEGQPTEYAVDGNAIWLNTTADQDYPIRLWYYGTPLPLSATNLTNFLTDRYPDMLEAALKYYAYRHREEDALADKWMRHAIDGIQTANAEYDLYKQQINAEAYWERA